MQGKHGGSNAPQKSTPIRRADSARRSAALKQGKAPGRTPSRKARRGKNMERVGAIMAVLLCAVAFFIWLVVSGGNKGDVQQAASNVTQPPPAQTEEALPEETEPVHSDETDSGLPGEGDPEEEEQALSARGFLEMGEIHEKADPSLLKVKPDVVSKSLDGKKYSRQEPISMGPSETYTDQPGVYTFAGNHYRDGARYGSVPVDSKSLKIVWTQEVGSKDGWGGVGWNGQPSIVRWADDVRPLLALTNEKKQKEGLVEVIYGALDGKIHFFDLEDGSATRKKSITVPSSIKGSVSVDPRGYPLLYCGQGLPEVNGKRVKIGFRAFSLIDHETLMFIDGREKHAYRPWPAFDSVALVDSATDTLIELGENGILYTAKLNTQFDKENGSISIDPKIDRYRYKSKLSGQLGMENSAAIYNHYVYFVDNAGLLQCVDLNTLKPVWARNVKDDTDATVVLEEADGQVALYTGCENDRQGKNGKAYLRRYDALSGELIWERGIDCSGNKENNGGVFGTPAVGKNQLSGLAYFHVARTQGGGTLFALDKQTGETVWSLKLGAYGWSTPVCVYDENGRGYVIIGSSSGYLRLVDGLSGEVLDSVELYGNIEGSPAVYEDMLVVGTRGRRVYGIRIS